MSFFPIDAILVLIHLFVLKETITIEKKVEKHTCLYINDSSFNGYKISLGSGQILLIGWFK